jgi:ferrous iron transport protein A
MLMRRKSAACSRDSLYANDSYLTYTVRAMSDALIAADRPATLDQLALGQRARVHRIDVRAAAQPAERQQQLADIGLVAGEAVAVVARAWPSGDPLVVRIGHSRFALRRAEAACVQVMAPE